MGNVALSLLKGRLKLPWILTILAGVTTLPVMAALPIFRLPEQPCPQCIGDKCVVLTCFNLADIAPYKTLWQIATRTANFIPVYCTGAALALVIAMLLVHGKAFFVVAGMAGIAALAYLYVIITWVLRYNVVNANPRPAHEVTGIVLLVCGGLLLLAAICVAVFRHITKQVEQRAIITSQNA